MVYCHLIGLIPYESAKRDIVQWPVDPATNPAAAPARGRKRMGKREKRLLAKYDGDKYRWLKGTKKFLLILILALLVLHIIVGFSAVKGDSMEPTLKDGELVLYTKLHSQYERGDIVSVRIPSGDYYVKRIIAMEGDVVDLRDGRVYVNGKPEKEPYALGVTQAKGASQSYPLTLEKGQIFLMGDNREASVDSRSFGPVGQRQIKGKLLVRVGLFYLHRV